MKDKIFFIEFSLLICFFLIQWDEHKIVELKYRMIWVPRFCANQNSKFYANQDNMTEMK